jgi:diketogulonate reductase-like aldo/keto reductase
MNRNEGEIGNIIREGVSPRGSLWITSKISTAEQGEEAAYQATKESLELLSCGYLDLMLIHWPGMVLFC